MQRIFLFFFLLITIGSFAQKISEKGVPAVTHFENGENKIFSHVWDIDEAPNHIMYFVNDDGLLQYDGLRWQLFKGSVGITRSVKVASNETIYTGSDNDFGIWKKDKLNRFTYTSLYKKLSRNSNQVEEFWNVFKIGGQVIFQSFKNLYVYADGQFTKIPAPSTFISGYQRGSEVFLMDHESGILTFDGFTLKKKLNVNNQITKMIAIEKMGSRELLISENNGLFTVEGKTVKALPTDLDRFIVNDKIFSFTKINESYFAVGTIRNGVIICDSNGRVIHFINKIKGLQHNTVLSAFSSEYGKLWLGLDFGIDKVDVLSPYSYIMDSEGEIGTTYTAVLDGETLYIGTNQGLYSTPFESLKGSNSNVRYSLVPGSDIQVWTLAKLNGEIFCGNNSGLLLLENGRLNRIDSRPGVWSVAKFGMRFMLTGNYDGIHAYEKQNGQWTYAKSLDKVYGSFNQILVKGNVIWALIPGEGVLEMTLDENLNILSRKLYPKSIFDSRYLNITEVNGRFAVKTLQSYYFRDASKPFGFVRYRDRLNPRIKNQLLADFFTPVPLNPRYSIYPVYNGFVLNDRSIREAQKLAVPAPHISRALSFTENNSSDFARDHRVKFGDNNIRLAFVVPNFPYDVQYQYFLEGFSENWSAWNAKNMAEFFHLSEGKYTLKVRSRYNNAVSPESTFSFTVAPPFYRTVFAKLMYFAGLLLLISLIRKYHHNKMERQKRQLLHEQEKQMEEQQRRYEQNLAAEKQAKLELEQQQLKRTIESKELQIARKVMEQSEVNSIISSIILKLEEVQRSANDKLSPNKYEELVSFLSKKMHKDAQKEYDIAFDSSQAKFHESLLKSHPLLSPKDLRIASYILMNLSSKEIANIMHVLPTSIDVNRSRLRKKLGLKDHENLREYLNRYL